MELLESNDPKTHLLRKAASQKQTLNDEVQFISDKTEKMIKNALIIGGTLAATYFIYNLLSDGDSKKKKRKIKVLPVASDTSEATEDESESPISGMISKVGTVLASQAAVFLLSLAKEKIGEYLETRATNKNDNTL